MDELPTGFLFTLPRWVPNRGDNVWVVSQKLFWLLPPKEQNLERLITRRTYFREVGSNALLYSTPVLCPISSILTLNGTGEDAGLVSHEFGGPTCEWETVLQGRAQLGGEASLWLWAWHIASANGLSLRVKGLLPHMQPCRGSSLQRIPVHSRDQQLTQMRTRGYYATSKRKAEEKRASGEYVGLTFGLKIGGILRSGGRWGELKTLCPSHGGGHFPAQVRRDHMERPPSDANLLIFLKELKIWIFLIWNFTIFKCWRLIQKVGKLCVGSHCNANYNSAGQIWPPAATGVRWAIWSCNTELRSLAPPFLGFRGVTHLGNKWQIVLFTECLQWAGLMLSSLPSLSHLILIMPPPKKYQYYYSTEKETEVQRRQVTCPKTHWLQMAELNGISVIAKAMLLTTHPVTSG